MGRSQGGGPGKDMRGLHSCLRPRFLWPLGLQRGAAQLPGVTVPAPLGHRCLEHWQVRGASFSPLVAGAEEDEPTLGCRGVKGDCHSGRIHRSVACPERSSAPSGGQKASRVPWWLHGSVCEERGREQRSRGVTSAPTVGPFAVHSWHLSFSRAYSRSRERPRLAVCAAPGCLGSLLLTALPALPVAQPPLRLPGKAEQAIEPA